MFLWVTLPEGISSLDLFDRALRQKVAFVPGQAFFVDGSGRNTLRLNYSSSDEAQIEEGIRRLADAIDALMLEAASAKQEVRCETIDIKRSARRL